MIFLDNASTTQASDSAINIITKYAKECYFNPSSMYHEGIATKKAIEDSRKRILKSIRAEGNFVFTSGGTESDNLALLGCKKQNGSRVIISATEHAAIYASAMELKKRGYDVQICPTDNTGKVIESDFLALINEKTSLISIIHTNNETGAVNDIQKLVKIAKSKNKNVLFHSDGVQAVGKIPVNVRALGVDMYSLSAHKLHSTKGTGGLYYKSGLHLTPIIIGGGQEGGLRSSTENVGGIVAFADAVEYSNNNLKEQSAKVLTMKQIIREGIAALDNTIFIENDDDSNYILSFSMQKVRGEVMQHALERQDILVGTGSACSSNKASKRIAEALGLKDKYIDGMVRISLSSYNTIAECNEFVSKFVATYKELSRYGS
ncbi:MAG: cysteine desulfurase family protein [Bacillota bacterium]